MSHILSQHYFQIYGADKNEIEEILKELKKNMKIHHFNYKGMVACAEAEVEPIEFSNIAINLDLNKKICDNMISKMGISADLFNFNATNAIGYEINQQQDKRGFKKY